jgi:ribonuclease E
MSKQIIINAIDQEEIRIATVEDGVLVDVCLQMENKEQLKGNIYKGRIVTIEPGLQAAFVEYADRRHGFLPFKEICPECYKKNSDKDPKKLRIQDVIEREQVVLVQVDRDERGSKGASLTTYISIPGRYVVIMPGENRRVGVSRKIEEQTERDKLRDIFDSIEPPPGMSFILRTAGVNRNKTEFESDLAYLKNVWNYIQGQAEQLPAPSLVYKEMDIAKRYIRDYLNSDIDEVLIDNREIYQDIKAFLKQISPAQQKMIKLYRKKEPIFIHNQIEQQLEHINKRKVPLVSGGYIVIDKTEALTSIDINSGRSRGEKNIEATAYKTNSEAVDEVARQLRLRDIGGLIVIDFIDMTSDKHRRAIQKRLKDVFKYDKAHIETAAISTFGLLEMSRERLRQTFRDSIHEECPHCEGTGGVKSSVTLAMMAFRKIQYELYQGNAAKITCKLPLDSANYLLNQKRASIIALEKDTSIPIDIIAAADSLCDTIILDVKKKEEQKPAKQESARGKTKSQQHNNAETKQERPETAQNKPELKQDGTETTQDASELKQNETETSQNTSAFGQDGTVIIQDLTPPNQDNPEKIQNPETPNQAPPELAQNKTESKPSKSRYRRYNRGRTKREKPDSTQAPQSGTKPETTETIQDKAEPDAPKQPNRESSNEKMESPRSGATKTSRRRRSKSRRTSGGQRQAAAQSSSSDASIDALPIAASQQDGATVSREQNEQAKTPQV